MEATKEHTGKRLEIQFREIVMMDSRGKRMRNAIKENYTTWETYGSRIFGQDIEHDLVSNFVECLNYLKAVMCEQHRSFTIHLHINRGNIHSSDRIKLAQVKWGYNNKPFIKIEYPTLAILNIGG